MTNPDRLPHLWVYHDDLADEYFTNPVKNGVRFLEAYNAPTKLMKTRVSVEYVPKEDFDEVSELRDLGLELMQETSKVLNKQAGESLAEAAERVVKELKECKDVLARVVKYAREDKAVTPGYTRLSRALAECDAILKKGE